MPYIGQPPVSGDTTKSFRLLDNIASYTLTFDGSSSDVVSTTNDTLTFNQHRFVTAQRVTYNNGGGTAIGGLSNGVYYIIKVDQNTIKLAASQSDANNNNAIDLTSLGVGTSHTLNIAFDSVNTKFKVTYGSGTKAKISRAGQLFISINGVIQQPQESATPTVGFGLEADSTLVFSAAPSPSDVVFGQILADTITNFDTIDNTVDNFTGDGTTTVFSLSKSVSSNNDILVTIDGVVQYPTDTTTGRSYGVVESTLTFTEAPANSSAIQVRHIGFAGATSSAVTGFYGRTGNVVLTNADNISVQNITGVAATFTGNVSIAGTLTYEDVTNIDSVGLITARSGIEFGISPGIGASISPAGNAVFAGVVTATSYSGASDTIKFETGGSERARIDSSGRFGLGTASPGSYNAAADNIVIDGGTNDTGITIDSTTQGVLAFTDTTDTTWEGWLKYDHSDDHLELGSGSSRRLTIDSSGRVVIGANSVTAGFSVQKYGTQLAVNGNSYMFPSGRHYSHLGTVVDGTHAFAGFDGGYGNTSGSCTLILQAGINNTNQEAGTYVSGELQGLAATALTFGHLTAASSVSGNATKTERMRIDTSGRLLVGTSTSGKDSAKLQIAGGDNTNHIEILNTTASDTDGQRYSYVWFRGTQSGGEESSLAFIGAVHDGSSDDEKGRLIFHTNDGNDGDSPTERLRIDSTGRVITKYAANGEIDTLSDGATITPDLNASNLFTVTLGGNRTLANPSNITAGQSGSIFIVQDGTGSRTLSFGSYWDFVGGTAPTLTTTASAVDRIDYVVRTSTSIHAVFTANYS